MTDTPPMEATNQGNNPNFVDVDKLKNSSGILAIISQRKDGSLSCGFFREWTTYDPMTGQERVSRGQFIPHRLMRPLLEMMELASKRMDQLAAGGGLPLPVPVTARPL